MRLPANRLDAKVLALWWTVSAGAAVIGVLLLVGGSLAVRGDFPGLPLLPTAAALSILLVITAAALPAIRYRRWRYEIRERDLFFSHGAIFFRQTLIPFDRIQFVESRQGPLDRAFGLAQIMIYTAAGKAGSIPGLLEQTAQSLRDELSAVAGTSSV